MLFWKLEAQRFQYLVFQLILFLFKIIGSITTPLPIRLVTPTLKIPEGIVCSTCLIPSNSSVWPAFGPP